MFVGKRKFSAVLVLVIVSLAFSCGKPDMEVVCPENFDIHLNTSSNLEFGLKNASSNDVVEISVSDPTKLSIWTVNGEYAGGSSYAYTIKKGDDSIDCQVFGLALCDGEKITLKHGGNEFGVTVNVTKFKALFHIYSPSDGGWKQISEVVLEDGQPIPSRPDAAEAFNFIYDETEYKFSGKWTDMDLSRLEPDRFNDGEDYDDVVSTDLMIYATYERETVTVSFKKMVEGASGGNGWEEIPISNPTMLSGSRFEDVEGLTVPGDFVYGGTAFTFKGWTQEDIEDERGDGLNVSSFTHKITYGGTFYATYSRRRLYVKYYFFDVNTGTWKLDTKRSGIVESGAPPAEKERDIDYGDFKYVCTGWTEQDLSSVTDLRQISAGGNAGVSGNVPAPCYSLASESVYATYRFSYDDDMVKVQGGTYHFNGREENSTTVSDFYISKYELSQEVYEVVMGDLPADVWPDGKVTPVYNLNWYQAMEFCNRISDMQGLDLYYNIDKVNKDVKNLNSDATDPLRWTVTEYVDNNGYRLPTEAEWEYAARGGFGAVGNGHVYSGSSVLAEVGWYNGNSGVNVVHSSGLKKPNELGLYDMSGNVSEWCWDWWYQGHDESGSGGDKYADFGKMPEGVNPKGAPPEEAHYLRVQRGGSISSEQTSGECKVLMEAERIPNVADVQERNALSCNPFTCNNNPFIGIRLVRNSL